MKIKVSVLFFCICLAAVVNAQEKAKNLLLLNSSANSVTLGTPAAVTDNTILLPGTLGLQGALMYISSVAAGPIGTTTWLNPGSNGTVLTLAAGVPSWAALPTTFADNVFRIFNSTTSTKIAAFSSASISAATTRTFTFPDVSGTLITTGNLSSITSTGTIASGTWNGTAIGPTFGGTGQTTYSLGNILYSSAANTLSKLAGNITATKKFLTQTGTGAVSAAPAWNAITAADVPVMVASGASHAAGIAPDPGVTSGTTKFLREDATWAAPPATTSISHLGANTGINSTSTNFLQFGGFGDNGIENKTQIVITRAATLQNLYINLTAAPGAGASKTVTVRVNGVNTALTVTVAGAATAGNNTANTVSVAAGDLLSIQVIHSAGPAPAGSIIATGMEIAM
ncbi:MAG: hypothetical protein ABI778_02420 [Ignavibacteriota bacterium]